MNRWFAVIERGSFMWGTRCLIRKVFDYYLTPQECVRDLVDHDTHRVLLDMEATNVHALNLICQKYGLWDQECPHTSSSDPRRNAMRMATFILEQAINHSRVKYDYCVS